MDRPTKESVDEAITHAERVGPVDAAWQFAHVLAAEVRALREEVARPVPVECHVCHTITLGTVD